MGDRSKQTQSPDSATPTSKTNPSRSVQEQRPRMNSDTDRVEIGEPVPEDQRTPRANEAETGEDEDLPGDPRRIETGEDEDLPGVRPRGETGEDEDLPSEDSGLRH